MTGWICSTSRMILTGENWIIGRNTCNNVTWSTANSTSSNMELNSDVLCDRPEANSLKHGTPSGPVPNFMDNLQCDVHCLRNLSKLFEDTVQSRQNMASVYIYGILTCHCQITKRLLPNSMTLSDIWNQKVRVFVLLTMHPCIIFFKWTQMGSHCFLVYLFQLLYMFRTTMCPSSRELTLSTRYWYFSLRMDYNLVCRPESHPYRVKNTGGA